MKSFLKKLQENQIYAVLIITGIVLMCLTLALTLNGRVLQDSVLKLPNLLKPAASSVFKKIKPTISPTSTGDAKPKPTTTTTKPEKVTAPKNTKSTK